jgi:hypothetical protein
MLERLLGGVVNSKRRLSMAIVYRTDGEEVNVSRPDGKFLEWALSHHFDGRTQTFVPNSRVSEPADYSSDHIADATPITELTSGWLHL